MTSKQLADYETDLASKSKEKPGGSFFQVWSKGKREPTVWARSRQELTDMRNKTRKHFDKIVELVR